MLRPDESQEGGGRKKKWSYLTLKTFEAQLKGSWSLLLVDSEPVQGALVKGYSAREDVCELVGVFFGN